jgi:hypothetical protein
MWAHNLKKMADQVNKNAVDPQIEEAYRRVSFDLKEAAKAGKYSHTLYLNTLNIPPGLWVHVIEKLRKDGFKVDRDTEMTAWYSNTDWDQEDVIRISWL